MLPFSNARTFRLRENVGFVMESMQDNEVGFKFMRSMEEKPECIDKSGGSVATLEAEKEPSRQKAPLKRSLKELVEKFRIEALEVQVRLAIQRDRLNKWKAEDSAVILEEILNPPKKKLRLGDLLAVSQKKTDE